MYITIISLFQKNKLDSIFYSVLMAACTTLITGCSPAVYSKSLILFLPLFLHFFLISGISNLLVIKGSPRDPAVGEPSKSFRYDQLYEVRFI